MRCIWFMCPIICLGLCVVSGRACVIDNRTVVIQCTHGSLKCIGLRDYIVSCITIHETGKTANFAMGKLFNT